MRYGLSIAAIFQNEAAYLEEWVEYHRAVGVEHFWLYDDGSTDEWREVLAPYLDEGVVEVRDWPIPNPLAFISRQVEAYQDALTRVAGTTTWLALIDTDEFLLPRRDATVTECLATHFPSASAIYVNWRQFGTGGITVPRGEPLLFQLTACADPLHPRNSVGKTIIRPERARGSDTYSPHFCLLDSEARYYNGDGEALAFKGVDLGLDGHPHQSLIRINHYPFRDETFFHTIRLERARKWGVEESLVWEHYAAFSQQQDHELPSFIERAHPDRYDRFWRRGSQR